MSEAEQLVGKLLEDKKGGETSPIGFLEAFSDMKERDGGNSSSKLKSDVAEANKQISALQISGDLSDKDFRYKVKDIEKYLTQNVDSDISIQANIAPGVTVGKGLTVGRGVEVDAGSKLGDGVQVGRDAIVHNNVNAKPGSVIGRQSEVGRGTVIEENAMVGFAATVGRSVHIGKNSRIDGSKSASSDIQNRAFIGENVLIDEGVTIGVGARIGDNVHVLSKAVVKPSEVIPANSVVDVRDPKVLKEIADEKSKDFFDLASNLKVEADLYDLLKPVEGESRKESWARAAASIKDPELRAAFDEMSLAQDKLDVYNEKHKQKK